MKLTKQILDALKHSTEYTSALFDVDPEGAAELLKINIGNRPVQKAAVDRYTKTMADGEWMISGEGMTVLNGVLISGQKRCMAIIRSGATIRIPITFGVDARTRTVIDGAEPRNPWAQPGVSKHAAEVLSVTHRIIFHAKKPGVSVVEAMVSSPLRAKAVKLWDYAPSKRRGVTSAPVRAAFAAGQLEWPAMAEHIADQYRAMTLSAFDKFSGITGLLYRQLTSATLPRSGFAAEHQRFSRSMFAIDPDNAQAKVIRLREDYDDVSMAKYREILMRHAGLGG